MTRHRGKHSVWHHLIFGGLAAAIGYIAVQSMPDVVRYLKIRSM